MKCPKCNYVSHDYLDTCRNAKCGIDLVDFKAQMQLHVIQAGEISLLSAIGSSPDAYGAAGAMSESIFDSQMLSDANESGDFDISLDDDLSLSPMSIAIDESAEISGIFNRPNFDFDAQKDGEATDGNRKDTGPLGPPTSGYATVMLDVGNIPDPNASQVDDGEESHSATSPALNVNDLDTSPDPLAGTTANMMADTLSPTVDPLADADFTSDSALAENTIPWQDDASELPAESAEINLFDADNTPSTPALDVNEADLLPMDTDDSAALPEVDGFAMPEAGFAQPEVPDSTEAAFSDFLPLQSEELDFSMLQSSPHLEPQDTPQDTDLNSATLTDEGFELPAPPPQEITLVDTQEDASLDALPMPIQDADQTAPGSLRDDALDMPPPPVADELDLTAPYDPTIADETHSQTLTDEVFEMPAPPAQEVTLVDTQEDNRPANPRHTTSIPLHDDAYELPPPPIADELDGSESNEAPLAAEPTVDITDDGILELPDLPTHGAATVTPQDDTIVDSLNSQTLTDDGLELPPLPTQEFTLVDTQDDTAFQDDLTPDAVDDDEGGQAAERREDDRV